MSDTATSSSEAVPRRRRWWPAVLLLGALALAAALWQGRQPAARAGGLAGRVSVAPALQARIAPTDTVFVYARPAEGSRMPVALLKKHGRDLPFEFTLDDSHAMTPEVRLSQHARVWLGVRVSRRGDVIPAPGDLQAEIGPVPATGSGHVLEIAREQP